MQQENGERANLDLIEKNSNMYLFVVLLINGMKYRALLVELSKVEQKTVLTLRNPHYSNIVEKYQHLKGVVIKNNNQKPKLPIHVVLDVREYMKIKTNAMIRVEKQGEPIAEKTHLGWTITSLGKDCNATSLTRNSMCD